MAEPVFGVGIDDKAALAGEDDDLAAIAEAEAFRLQLARRALPADWRIARRRAFLQIDCGGFGGDFRSEEHTSELQSLMRISYAVFCLKKQKKHNKQCTERNK